MGVAGIVILEFGAGMRFLFENCQLDTTRRELRRGSASVSVEPQVFDVLAHLIANRERVVSKDDLISAVWGGRIVSDSAMTTRINQARFAIGDSGEQQRLIKTYPRKGFRFVGEVREESIAQPDQPKSSEQVVRQKQEITSCRTADGAQIAIASSGLGKPVVRAATWLTHLEYDWQNPVWSPLLKRLSNQFRLIRYDERGSGLSDWDVADISFDAFVSDLEAVVDAVGLDRFALFGFSRGAAVSIAYAARNPDRVERLVISSGFAQGWRRRSTPEQIAQREAMLTMLRYGWGQEDHELRQVMTATYVPNSTMEQAKAFADLQRITTSPENAVRLQQAAADFDVTGLLPQVRAKTLVLHGWRDTFPLEQGLAIARGIPNARFVALNSGNHVMLSHEPDWERYLREVCDFLDEDADPNKGSG